MWFKKYRILSKLCHLTAYKKEKATVLFISHCRGENQLEEGEDAVPVVLAVCFDMGSVSHSGLGSIRPRTLWPVLLTCLGPDEIWGILFCYLPVLLQPGHAYCHHPLLLLWHRHQTLFHLQKVDAQQPQNPQHRQAPSEAVTSESLFTEDYKDLKL